VALPLDPGLSCMGWNWDPVSQPVGVRGGGLSEIPLWRFLGHHLPGRDPAGGTVAGGQFDWGGRLLKFVGAKGSLRLDGNQP